jgi:hypothetical protein
MSRAPSKSDPPQPEDGLPVYSAARLHAMDRAFAERLRAAIKSGAERCPIGTDVTPSTKRPRVLSRPPTMIARSSFVDNPATEERR